MSKKINRKDFFQKSLSNIGSFFNEILSEELDDFSALFPEIIRPPGAQKEDIFQNLCTRCGDCIRACPFFSLQSVFRGNQFDLGTPSLRLEEAYCRFCEDIPCINACQTQALSKEIYNNQPTIGTAKIISKNCLRNNSIDCVECKNSCPTVPNSISITSKTNLPNIDAKICTGCGACLIVCPASPAKAIKIIAR